MSHRNYAVRIVGIVLIVTTLVATSTVSAAAPAATFGDASDAEQPNVVANQDICGPDAYPVELDDGTIICVPTAPCDGTCVK